MIDLNNLTHEEKELLADDCEDFLLHRNIPLRSHSMIQLFNMPSEKGISLKSLIVA